MKRNNYCDRKDKEESINDEKKPEYVLSTNIVWTRESISAWFERFTGDLLSKCVLKDPFIVLHTPLEMKIQFPLKHKKLVSKRLANSDNP